MQNIFPSSSIIIEICLIISVIGGFVFVGKMLNFFLRFLTIPLLSKICSDKTGGINDGLPTPLVPLFGK